MRYWLVEWPAYLWDRFWFLYTWYLAIISALLIMVTFGTLLLWLVGYPQRQLWP